MARTAPNPERLPRGRHRLTREEVVRSQRERMLRALAETMTEKGYVGTSVADVLRGAGVSRETFYQQFSSKEDCFMSAFESAVATIIAVIGEMRSAEGDPMDNFDRALGTYLEVLAAEPAFARLFLLEVYAAGPAALERRAQSQQRFADLVCEVFGARTRERRFACEALVAATSSMVTARLAADDIEGLRALQRPLTELARRMLVDADGFLDPAARESCAMVGSVPGGP